MAFVGAGTAAVTALKFLSKAARDQARWEGRRVFRSAIRSGARTVWKNLPSFSRRGVTFSRPPAPSHRQITAAFKDHVRFKPNLTMARKRRRFARRKRFRRPNRRTGGFQGIELKFHDVSKIGTLVQLPAAVAPSGGEIDPTDNALNAMAQGPAEDERLGKRIVVKSIQVTGIVERVGGSDVAATVKTGAEIFLAIVLDTQSNGATINSEDVWTNPSASTNMAVGLLRNMEQIKRFKIIKHWKFRLPVQAGFWDGGVQIRDSVHHRWHTYKKVNIPILFKNNAAAGIANIVDNSLHLVGFTTDNSSIYKYEYNSRIRFVG